MWLDSVAEKLRAIGLNAVGVAAGHHGAELLPGCRAVIVFASGGTALWDAFLADVRRSPAHLTQSRHPFDDFVARSIAAADPNPPASRRWVRCAAEPEAFLDFRLLAHAAGLGWRSRLGLLLNPTYGLWMGLRAACLTSDPLPLSAPLEGNGPCDSCPSPCVIACPGGALAEGVMNIRRCASFHLESARCRGRCDARLACPIGAEHRHGALQHCYHNDRERGRKLLAQTLGLANDAHEGQGPHWDRWKENG